MGRVVRTVASGLSEVKAATVPASLREPTFSLRHSNDAPPFGYKRGQTDATLFWITQPRHTSGLSPA